MAKDLDDMQQGNWSWGGTTGFARYVFSDDFVDENGVSWAANTYLEVPTTIADEVVSIPAYPDFPETEAAVTNNGVTVSCYLYDSNHVKRTTLFDNVRIYTSLSSPISLDELVLANGASRLLRDTDVWTKEQVIDYVATRPPAGKMTSIADGVGRLSLAAASIGDPIVVGDNDPRVNTMINVVSYGVVGDGVADDTAACQAALNAASDGSIVYKPGNLTMKISATLLMDNKQGVTFKLSEVRDGYGHNHHDIDWVGPVDSPIISMKDCGSCTVEGGFLYSNIVGTSGVDIDAINNVPTATSNVVQAMHFNFLKATVNSFGVKISSTTGTNHERMQIRNCRFSFAPDSGVFTDITNLTRGVAIRLGATGGMGVNIKNAIITDCYWIGCTYGVEAWHGEGTSFNCESNYATIDYLFNSVSFTVIRHYSEGARQFAKGRNDIQLYGNQINFGGWDPAYPIVEMCLPGGAGGQGNLIMIGNQYDSQVGVNAVDATGGGTYIINHGGNNGWPTTAPTLANFAPYAENFDILNLREVLFANLAVYVPPAGKSAILYCSNATPGTNPATGGGTGAFVVRQNGAWRAL